MKDKLSNQWNILKKSLSYSYLMLVGVKNLTVELYHVKFFTQATIYIEGNKCFAIKLTHINLVLKI